MSAAAKLSVRRAGFGDLDAVAEVWFESASRMDGAAAAIPSCLELRSRIDQELDAGWDLHIALLDERVVGMLALKPVASKLDQLFVRPTNQGIGIGQALLEVAKRIMPDGFTLRVASSKLAGPRVLRTTGPELIDRGDSPSHRRVSGVLRLECRATMKTRLH